MFPNTPKLLFSTISFTNCWWVAFFIFLQHQTETLMRLFSQTRNVSLFELNNYFWQRTPNSIYVVGDLTLPMGAHRSGVVVTITENIQGKITKYSDCLKWYSSNSQMSWVVFPRTKNKVANCVANNVRVHVASCLIMIIALSFELIALKVPTMRSAYYSYE